MYQPNQNYVRKFVPKQQSQPQLNQQAQVNQVMNDDVDTNHNYSYQKQMPFNPYYNQQEQVSGPASPMSKPATVPSPMTLSQTQMTSPNVVSNDSTMIQQQFDFINLRLERLEQIVSQQQIMIMLQQQLQPEILHTTTEKQSQQQQPQQQQPQQQQQQPQQQQQQVPQQSSKLNQVTTMDNREQNQAKLNQSLNHLCELFEKFFTHQLEQRKGLPSHTVVSPGNENANQNNDDKKQPQQLPQQQPQRILTGNENVVTGGEDGLDLKKFAKRETKSADRQKQKSISRMRIHPKESPQQVKLYQPPRRDSLTKNVVEKVKRIPSDAPTALIAPTDYEHIYSVKNTKARYHEDEQHRLAQIKHDHPNKK